MIEKRILWLILLLFVSLGAFYAVSTPVFEASDELWHYPMVRHLADGNPLPVQVFDPDEAGPWKQEASQPPLYYFLAAAATFWIDTSDMERARWLNPHVDNGIITEDGNVNLVIHDPAADPWTGTQLAVRVTRLISVVLGAATVYLTYLIASAAVPGRPEVALGAAAVNAFTPMFLFISGAVNNDNLVIPLASLSLLLSIQIVQDGSNNRWARYGRPILLGAVIGLGALTKISAIGLLALAGFALFMDSWRRNGRHVAPVELLRALGRSMLSFLLVLTPILLIAGWWYLRNIQLYGDWRGWNAFIAVLGKRAHPASLAQLWDERWGFMTSFWGLFGGLNVPMSDWIYRLLNVVLLVSVAGFVVYSVQIIRAWMIETKVRARKLSSVVYNTLAFVERHFALALCVLWSAAVVIGLIQWATVTWSSQGRLVFSSISALSTLLATGLIAWMPEKPARVVITSLALFMLIVSAAAPLLWIGPAYVPIDAQAGDTYRDLNLDYGGVMRLKGFSLEPDEIRPGESVTVSLRWQALGEMERDWSVFVHLNDPTVNSPVAQRDMFPGQGLVATSLLARGESVTDRYVLHLPGTALAPADLTLSVGLYDYQTGERLPASDGLDAPELAQVRLTPLSGSAPNPLTVNFENELELVGFTMDERRLVPGESAELSLYWRSLSEVDVDYTMFVQIVDEDTTRWASQDLTLPTSEWSKGEIQEVSLAMDVSSEAPAGVFPLIVGLYTRSEDGEIVRLQTITAEGRLTEDFFSLTDVRIE
ncbi:MAG: glycosyltransferase family 39 protein [Chloroflexota bacterium]|nr:MAG: glycosyltransferase family 39 protein [Chloroflexota bacterium]